MGSLAFSSPLARDASGIAGIAARSPELNESDYMREVLAQPAGTTEEDLDAALAARAAELKIDLSTLSSRPTTAKSSTTSTIPNPSNPSAGSLNADSNGSSAVPTNGRPRTQPVIPNGITSNALTSRGSILLSSGLAEAAPKLMSRRSNILSFSEYDRYLSRLGPNLTQPKFFSACPAKPERPISVFSVSSTRTSVKDFRQGLVSRLKWKRKPPQPSHQPGTFCICCRDDFDTHRNTLYTLPCNHTYCPGCIVTMVNQSIVDESKMPPRCCTQPIPAPVFKAVLSREEQQKFLRAVRLYSTPWEARIFCPGPECGEFIPPRSKPDPKHPFQVVCRSCKTRVCVMCKRTGHKFGQDCPEDWELDAVLKIGERSGWRRCYKCRALVELNEGCTHMTCRCKAQFCYVCGGIWDPVVGCPNFCNGDEELERRRVEEEARLADLEAQRRAREEEAVAEEAERARAEERSRDSPDFHALREAQAAEMDRLAEFDQKMKWSVFNRHSERRLSVVEKYSDQLDKMRERHAKTEAHLEDRQIENEIELQASLAQKEKSIQIKLRHMEAYCSGLGRSKDGAMPDREVTQKDLEKLGEQYRVRDGIERRHKAQINVLREKQVKRMEELQDRQEKELEALMEKRSSELENLGIQCANEEEALVQSFFDRRARMQKRWQIAIEILRKELELRDGVEYASTQPPEWPRPQENNDAGLPSVIEEEA